MSLCIPAIKNGTNSMFACRGRYPLVPLGNAKTGRVRKRLSSCYHKTQNLEVINKDLMSSCLGPLPVVWLSTVNYGTGRNAFIHQAGARSPADFRNDTRKECDHV